MTDGQGNPLSGEAEREEAPHEEAAVTSPPSRRLHRLFIGPHGLRAGWRFLRYVGIFGITAIVFFVGFAWLCPLVKLKSPPVWVNLVSEFGLLLSAFAAAVAMGKFEHRPLDDYGLPRHKAFGKDFWAGVIWGFIALSVLLLMIGGVGDFTLGGLALHGLRIWKLAAFWGLFFLFVGFFEEFLFRGYTLFTLTQGMGFWPSALLLSAIFGGVHLGNAGEAWIGALAAGMIGLFFCLTLRRTGSLWFAVGFHASWDWAESYFYSVPDSGEVSPGHLLNSSFHGSRWLTGGSVGPEGSLFVPVVIVALWIVFERVYGDARQEVGGF